MIGAHFQKGKDCHRDRVLLIHGGTCASCDDIGRLVDTLVEAWCKLSGKRIGVCITSPLHFIGTVVALDLLGAHIFLVGQCGKKELNELKTTFRWDGLLRDEDIPDLPVTRKQFPRAPYAGKGMVTILTSGTTGTPKATNHSWSNLTLPVRRENRYLGTRWLAPYSLNLYAGIQVFLQSFLNWATLVIPESLEPGDIARTIREARVTHASGTPTFWRRLLLFAPRDVLRACELEQITLGGEIASQELLDSLRVVFPQARIVHIYASTELGRVFSVTDGHEGFPTKFLHEPPEGGSELRIVDGELMARSHNAMVACDGHMPMSDKDQGWFATGDLVEIRGNRVFFKGRSNDVINVGGSKVFPIEVEAALRGVPGVIHIRVYAKKSSLIGQIVAADVVLAPDTDNDAVGAELQRVAREKLQPHQIPRILRVVPEMAISGAFKIVREKTQE